MSNHAKKTLYSILTAVFAALTLMGASWGFSIILLWGTYAVLSAMFLGNLVFTVICAVLIYVFSEAEIKTPEDDCEE